MMTKKSTVPMFDVVCAWQTLCLEWRAHLTMAERDLLCYLQANSMGYGRRMIRLSVGQIADGSISPRTGDLWLVPSGLSRSTIIRTVASLKQKGALIYTPGSGRRAASYQLNLDWDYPVIPKFPISKKRRAELAAMHPGAEDSSSNEQNDARSGVNVTPLPNRSGVNVTPTVLIELSTCLHRGSGSGKPDGPQGVGKVGKKAQEEESADAVVNRIKNRKSTKEDKDKNLKQIWTEAHKNGGLGIPVLIGPKDLGQLARVRDRLGERGPEFLLWALTRWPQIVAEHFGWMNRTAPPTRPDPNFMLTHANVFIEAFGVHLRVQEAGGTPDEQELRRLVETGLSPEAALIEIGRRKALGDERGEIARERKLLNEEFATLAGERKALRQLPPLRTARAPIDPPVVIDHGSNPWESGESVHIETEFGEFE